MTPVPAPRVTPAPPCASGLRPHYKTYGVAQTSTGPGSGTVSAVSSRFYRLCLSYQLPGAKAVSNPLSGPQIDDPSD